LLLVILSLLLSVVNPNEDTDEDPLNACAFATVLQSEEAQVWAAIVSLLALVRSCVFLIYIAYPCAALVDVVKSCAAEVAEPPADTDPNAILDPVVIRSVAGPPLIPPPLYPATEKESVGSTVTDVVTPPVVARAITLLESTSEEQVCVESVE